jgi:Rrf2 family protein
MRLTRAGEYAIRCVLFLSNSGAGEIANRKEISRVMDIPNQFLGKIAQQLARSGIIEIIQGARGGYRLLISPEKLSLLDVVESVIGEIYLNDCVIRPETCENSPTCSVHRIWEKARDQLRDTLRESTFAQILAEDSCTTELLNKVSASRDEESHTIRKGEHIN